LIGNSKKHIVAGTNELVQNAKNWANLDDGFSPFGYKPNILAFSTRLLIGNGGNQFHSGANEHRQNAKNWAKLEMGKTEKFAGNVY